MLLSKKNWFGKAFSRQNCAKICFDTFYDPLLSSQSQLISTKSTRLGGFTFWLMLITILGISYIEYKLLAHIVKFQKCWLFCLPLLQTFSIFCVNGKQTEKSDYEAIYEAKVTFAEELCIVAGSKRSTFKCLSRVLRAKPQKLESAWSICIYAQDRREA